MSGLKKLSRREFLQQTGIAGGGLVFALTATASSEQTAGPIPVLAEQNVAPNVYVNLRSDGKVEIVCHRSEMGQGIRTCLPQIIADELDADWDKIVLLQGEGDEKYGDQNTDGSTSIRKQFDLLRSAGASAREMLVAAAAAQWGVDASECTTEGHAVRHADSGRTAAYGSLVATAATLQPPESPSFKSPDDYRYIGKSVDLIDGFDMTTGRADYGIDTVLPEMVYASIERCPVFGGSVAEYDDTATRKVAGVLDVIEMSGAVSPAMYKPWGGVAVIATNTWAAQKGREALQIQWDKGPNAGYDSTSYRSALQQSAREDGRVALERGDVSQAFAEASSTHEAEYFAPHLSQAPMEPPAATARINEDGSCEVWACTQHPQVARQTVADLLGIDKAQVTVNVTLLGGGFGRKSKADFVAEAAMLARESGKPVKVTWTREDDIRHGYLHAVSAQCIKAALNEDNSIAGWEQCTAFPSISSTFATAVTGPQDGELGLGCVDNPLDVPNMKLMAGDAEAHLRIGWLRSVCNVYHAFANSSFVDELAHKAGADPREYLLQALGAPRQVDPTADGATYNNYGQSLEQHPIDTGRIAAVVDKVSELSGWGRSMPKGRGLGLAVHRSFLTTVATVAEVSANESGKLVVHELWFAVDAGQVINPDRVAAQMEGAGIFGMSLTLHGEISASEGAIEQGNFDTYPVLRMNESPAAINVHIMDVDAPPGGIGEPGVPPVAPAITNAWFAATGQRIRELPLRNSGVV